MSYVMNLDPQHAASTIDPALLARVVKGDQQAFGQLYDASSTLLYSLAMRILGNREDASELLQEVYLEVWRKVARYDAGRSTPIAWLITLTRSRAIDRLRARGARAMPHADPAPGTPAAGQTGERPAAAFDAPPDHELRQLVVSALAGLPHAQHQAIELAYYDGLSHAEIAVRFNQPQGTVKTRIKLGMSKLRESLRQYWEHRDRP
jgi:RNA polymerase sigma-70 factor (ECF subfamily)